jgi:4-amino-4-deoxy-L-arabinose transferase-like glycosyltransferase
VVVLVWLALLGMRLLAPNDLIDRDQGLSCAYILNAAYQGEWICQLDHHGDAGSKPPLHNWLGALAVLAFGNNLFAVGLPSALATLALALWIAAVGSRRFGERAGALASLSFLLCVMTTRLLVVVRSDPLFALLVALAAGAAFLAWRDGRSWHPFWIFATLATLAKGPLGLVLAAGGLMAVPWMRREEERGRPARGWWVGLLYYVAVSGGWFLLAWWDKGDLFINEVVHEELLGHVVKNDAGQGFLETFYKPVLYLLGRYLPWSLVTLTALWRTIRRPARETGERAFERFLACWLGVGLLVLSLAAHKRADLLAPLLPPAALLTGRELARLSATWSAARLRAVVAATVVAAFALLTVYSTVHVARRDMTRKSVVARAFALDLAERLEDASALEFATRDFTPQLYLGTFRFALSDEEALEALTGEEPAWVVARGGRRLEEAAEATGAEVFVLHRGKMGYRLLSNRPRLPGRPEAVEHEPREPAASGPGPPRPGEEDAP